MFLEYNQCFKLLSKYKLKSAISYLAKSSAEAVKHAKGKYPVVLKISSKDVVHKSDMGGIKVDIKNKAALIKAYDSIKNSAKKAKVEFNGVYVQDMLQGYQMYIGAKRDAQFGPVVTFGMGGIYVEIMKDVAYRMAPVGIADAKKMIKETKAFKLLSGARGMEKANVDSLAQIIVGISKLMMREKQVEELDLNPVIVNEKQAKIADARMMMRDSEDSRRVKNV